LHHTLKVLFNLSSVLKAWKCFSEVMHHLFLRLYGAFCLHKNFGLKGLFVFQNSAEVNFIY